MSGSRRGRGRTVPLPGRSGAGDRRCRFTGEICGFGTASGHRVVVGRWPTSPFGPVADVMSETPDGHRTLRAPTIELAEFVAATYRFDEVVVGPVTATRGDDALAVAAGDLAFEVAIGGRDALGWLLHAVPSTLATAPAWATIVDLPARALLAGVRTRGGAGGGRREWYGARDSHRLTSVHARLEGTDLGALRDVWPPVTFGFGSTPRRPRLVALTTTIELPAP